jgi:hypothetical protein
VGPLSTHKGYLFSSDEGKGGFFFVLEDSGESAGAICGLGGIPSGPDHEKRILGLHETKKWGKVIRPAKIRAE